MRIKKCLPFGRAVDPERKKLLLGDEHMDFYIQAIKDKLIGFAHRTTTDLMSTGSELGRFTVAPTWMSTSKLADEAILPLPVMTDVGKLERLLTFQFAFRDYSVLSLDDFIKGGYLDEQDPALLRATLLRAQELMAGVFGASFGKVFQNFIDAIQDTYRGYDGEFLRFLIEEVLYRYGQLMSEPWSEGLKVTYNLQDIHSPGNAATLSFQQEQTCKCFPGERLNRLNECLRQESLTRIKQIPMTGKKMLKHLRLNLSGKERQPKSCFLHLYLLLTRLLRLIFVSKN
jgi:hypothetical protein